MPVGITFFFFFVAIATFRPPSDPFTLKDPSRRFRHVYLTPWSLTSVRAAGRKRQVSNRSKVVGPESTAPRRPPVKCNNHLSVSKRQPAVCSPDDGSCALLCICPKRRLLKPFFFFTFFCGTLWSLDALALLS